MRNEERSLATTRANHLAVALTLRSQLLDRDPEAFNLIRLDHHQSSDQAASSIWTFGEIPDPEVMLPTPIGLPFQGLVSFDECLEQLVSFAIGDSEFDHMEMVIQPIAVPV
ncbi:hypothetical protein FQV39_13770 [Bosea sp. F3-2]|uniref:hypothetical protein n=1 Tax=Bosea sp. F3-2 TaxID=2599640 RepID=UPI0011ED2E34|nr:hypothetical protein [Bosea sp. F3-2]QEL23529.1 hypothetical protein FQV39_13770 [Bosea sp. F3-2]